jgi:hypothetical protein
MESFIFIKRIETTANSIFYSAIKWKNKIIAFGRRYYGVDRHIKKIRLDIEFNVLEDKNELLIGEDPRCFIHNDTLYVVDNYLNDTHLINYDTNQRIKVNMKGKNLSFISHNQELYFTYYLKPFALCKLDLHTGIITKIPVEDDRQHYNFEYRGGTPGYKLNDTDYYGYGHRTYFTEDKILKHDIFKWIISFSGEKPSIKIIEVNQPVNSKNICDPTSIIEIQGKKYMFTAESEYGWFRDQDYITNVYQIQE